MYNKVLHLWTFTPFIISNAHFTEDTNEEMIFINNSS